MNELKNAIKTISDIYSDYLESETDIVNLMPYDEALQEVHSALEEALKEKQERDNAVCKHCEYHKKAKFTSAGFLVCAETKMEILDNAFCSYFEKEIAK